VLPLTSGNTPPPLVNSYHWSLQHPNLWLLIAGPTIRLAPRHAKVRRDGYRR